MKNEDKKAFANIMIPTAEIYNVELSKIKLQIYFMALAEYTIDEVKTALETCVKRLKFFPRPVEIIEMITGKGGDPLDIGRVEAGKVLQAISRHGAYNSIDFEDHFTKSVIQNFYGGWIEICKLPLDDPNERKWFIENFSKHYRATAYRKEEHAGHLAGLVELNNSAEGFNSDIPEPIFYEDGGGKGKQKQIESK